MPVLRMPLVVVLFLSFFAIHQAGASPPAANPPSRSPLDDTPGIIDLSPDTSHVLAGTQLSLTVNIVLTDARVFDVQFTLDSARLQLLSVTAGSESSLQLMPPSSTGSHLTLDGFFHPNFSGTTLLATLTFYVKPVTGNDTTVVRFFTGQGYSGAYDNPVPIQFSGDSALIFIEGTPLPEPPSELLITRMLYPANDDSVLLRWRPVFCDVNGDTVINPLYVLYREDVINSPGLYDSIAATPDTFYYDNYILLNFPRAGSVNTATYKVVARKTQP